MKQKKNRKKRLAMTGDFRSCPGMVLVQELSSLKRRMLGQGQNKMRKMKKLLEMKESHKSLKSQMGSCKRMKRMVPEEIRRNPGLLVQSTKGQEQVRVQNKQVLGQGRNRMGQEQSKRETKQQGQTDFHKSLENQMRMEQSSLMKRKMALSS